MTNGYVIKTEKLHKKSTQNKKPTILHVEDDGDLLKIFMHLIQEKANIVGVTDLKQAKTELNNHHYDLVILDLLLTDGLGVELLPIINEKKIPVIVFSAYDLPENYSSCVAKTLIKSKVTPDELIKTINGVLAKKTRS